MKTERIEMTVLDENKKEEVIVVDNEEMAMDYWRLWRKNNPDKRPGVLLRILKGGSK